MVLLELNVVSKWNTLINMNSEIRALALCGLFMVVAYFVGEGIIETLKAIVQSLQ